MTAAAAPFVSVVVPVRNGENTIADCIRSLLALDYPPDRREILLIDNGSTDRTAEIAAMFPVTHLLEGRIGRAYARNRGVAESHGELVAFLDADCIASADWLRQLVSVFEQGPDVDGVAGEILPYRPTTPAERYMARKKPRWQLAAYTHVRPFAVTANVAYRKEVFRRIGLFDPFFVTSEDVDFSYRFFRAGLGLRYCEQAAVYHQDRVNARELFKQQYGLGYGRALARTVYRLDVRSWELEGYRDLALGVGRLALTAGGRVGHAAQRASAEELSFAYHDVVLLAALRFGALHWHVARFRRRTRSGPPKLTAVEGPAGA